MTVGVSAFHRQNLSAWVKAANQTAVFILAQLDVEFFDH